jgi:hypothetical protein
MPPIVWDIERNGSICGRCNATIGAGEAFRRSLRVVNRKFCERCSLAIDGTAAPTDIQPLTFGDRMRADIELVSSGGGQQ